MDDPLVGYLVDLLVGRMALEWAVRKVFLRVAEQAEEKVGSLVEWWDDWKDFLLVEWKE